ncbi:MAG: hypothetical protein ACOC2U_03575 [bacterium]
METIKHEIYTIMAKRKTKKIIHDNITVQEIDHQLKIILNGVHYTLHEEYGMLSILKVNKRDTGTHEIIIKPHTGNKILIY